VLGPDVMVTVRENGIPDPTGLYDPVTGLDGPVLWRHLLASELARSTRYRRPLTIVLVEAEGLTDLHLEWGEDAATATILEIALCIRGLARSSDHCARIGPTRFGILLTETDEIAAINFVERVRETGPGSLSRAADRVRFTFGWTSPHPGEAAEAVLRRAESRMAADRAV
jgi:two-component system cell cycle response regulator